MKKENYSKPLNLKSVEINDKFWGHEQELVRKEVIPYQWEALNDRGPGAAPSFCMRNFKVAGRLMREKRENKKFIEPKYTFRGFNALPKEGEEPENDKFYGFVFQDSDFSKWIEAVGYSLAVHPDEELEKIADGAIDIVCAAQAENGYLDTYYIIGGMDRIFFTALAISLKELLLTMRRREKISFLMQLEDMRISLLQSLGLRMRKYMDIRDMRSRKWHLRGFTNLLQMKST